ncbi:DUF6630 family protein [Xanthomonas sacchari]
MRRFFAHMRQKLCGGGVAPRYGVESKDFAADFDGEELLDEFQVASIRALVELLAERLGAERAAALALRASQAFETEDSSAMAFATATSLKPDCALSIYVDWNASSEVEWQVNRIFETLELPDRWRWAPGEDRSMAEALRVLENWLSLQGYHLWHVLTDGDDMLAFPVKTKDAVLAEKLAREGGMILFTLNDAEPYYGFSSD